MMTQSFSQIIHKRFFKQGKVISLYGNDRHIFTVIGPSVCPVIGRLGGNDLCLENDHGYIEWFRVVFDHRLMIDRPNPFDYGTPSILLWSRRQAELLKYFLLFVLRSPLLKLLIGLWSL